jgi:hypothetical protein
MFSNPGPKLSRRCPVTRSSRRPAGRPPSGNSQGAYIIGRAMEALLFQTNGTDPRVFTVSVAVLGFAAAFAAYIPARRASSLDPMVALRSD